MSARIPQDVIDRVMAAHDIVEVVSRHLPLEKRGRAWKALCPFHEEKTASFTVNPDRQSWKCFGCGRGGNVFGFLMERDGLSFPEAVRLLAGEKMIAVPASGPRDDREGSRVEAIRGALALAQDLFVRTLAGPRGESARAYLRQRGFPDDAQRALGLGLSPDGWDGLLEAARAKGVPASVLEDAGLAVRRENGSGHYDRFRRRLMFPIADPQGRLVTYGARALEPDDQPKYLNGPETPVFRKGRLLYALDRAKDGIRKAGHAVLMEGYTDVLISHLHGVTECVAGMGTAFTPEQARLLARFAERVVLLYDGDAAGRAAAEKSLDVLLEEGLEVRIALLPEGRDADEVVLEEGADRLREIVASAKDLFDFKYDALAARLDLSTVRGRATAATELASSARRVKGLLEQGLLLRRIAERLGVREDLLRAEAAEDAASRRRRPAPSPPSIAAGDEDPDARLRASGLAIEQERLVTVAVFRPEHLAEVRAVLPPDDVVTPGLAALWRALLAMADEEGAASPEGLSRRVADDAEASKALAGLPDDVPSDDWLHDALRFRAERRATEERKRAYLARLSGPAGSGPGSGPGSEALSPSPGGAPPLP